jgi:hypothetical protein
MKKPVAPDWLKEAVKNCKSMDQLDPSTQKVVRRFMREYHKWERGGLTVKDYQAKRKLEREQQQREWEDGITQRWNDIDENAYKTLLLEQENTIDWNWGGGCKYCGCQSLRIVKTPHLTHWGKFACNLCHRYNDWIPYPKEGSVPFVDRSKTMGCEFK